MKKLVTALAVVVATSVLAGCIVDDRGYRRRLHHDDAWDVVRNDPCRYEEYRDFARDHKNPEKRRRYVEYLAREGCSRKYSRDRDDRYDRYPD